MDVSTLRSYRLFKLLLCVCVNDHSPAPRLYPLTPAITKLTSPPAGSSSVRGTPTHLKVQGGPESHGGCFQSVTTACRSHSSTLGLPPPVTSNAHFFWFHFCNCLQAGSHQFAPRDLPKAQNLASSLCFPPAVTLHCLLVSRSLSSSA